MNKANKRDENRIQKYSQQRSEADVYLVVMLALSSMTSLLDRYSWLIVTCRSNATE